MAVAIKCKDCGRYPPHSGFKYEYERCANCYFKRKELTLKFQLPKLSKSDKKFLKKIKMLKIEILKQFWLPRWVRREHGANQKQLN